MERTQAYRARGTDEQVHVVEAPPDGLLDPSPYRARCGQSVIELYNDHPDVTCRVCSGGG